MAIKVTDPAIMNAAARFTFNNSLVFIVKKRGRDATDRVVIRNKSKEHMTSESLPVTKSSGDTEDTQTHE